MLTKDITIEELVQKVPAAVKYLSQHGIVCIMCGEPVWGTLVEVAKEKGKSDREIDQIVKDLQTLAAEGNKATAG